MRAPTALALSILATAPALGADFPVLRGSFAPAATPRADDDDQNQWAGFYVGGLATYSSSNFRNSGWPTQLQPGFFYNTDDGSPPASPEGVLLGSNRRGGFGGFIGYNMVFGEAMIGVEADLVRSSTSVSASQTYIPAFGPFPSPKLGYALGTLNSATISGVTKLDAYGSIRARIGWAYGNFLPFITGGLAIGKGSYNTVLTAEVAGTPPTTVVAGVAQKKDVYLYGGTVGAGIDVLLASNILLRAEYQYTRFDGTSIPVAINTVRVGAGVKF